MLKITNGDILKAKTEAVVNAVNTAGIMGSGLALQFKKAFPDMFKEYVDVCKAKELYIGRLHIYEPKDCKFRYIINFPTKKNYRNNSKLKDIETGLKMLAEKIELLNINSIAIPALVYQNEKLDFSEVLLLMIEILYDIYKTKKEVYIYRPL